MFGIWLYLSESALAAVFVAAALSGGEPESALPFAAYIILNVVLLRGYLREFKDAAPVERASCGAVAASALITVILFVALLIGAIFTADQFIVL